MAWLVLGRGSGMRSSGLSTCDSVVGIAPPTWFANFHRRATLGHFASFAGGVTHVALSFGDILPVFFKFFR
ncbi:hypothetical protein I7I48_06345 [Histoplasma ohiense]|nr:hypothetical protein I7I48_06345 [Histoplasma ohiense (nom. inval.)]